MSYTDIRTTDDALEYMVECTLATVYDLCMKSKPPKGEFRRQIAIAQKGLDYIPMSHNCKSRVGEVRESFGGSVQFYADTLFKRWHKSTGGTE